MWTFIEDCGLIYICIKSYKKINDLISKEELSTSLYTNILHSRVFNY